MNTEQLAQVVVPIDAGHELHLAFEYDPNELQELIDNHTVDEGASDARARARP